MLARTLQRSMIKGAVRSSSRILISQRPVDFSRLYSSESPNGDARRQTPIERRVIEIVNELGKGSHSEDSEHSNKDPVLFGDSSHLRPDLGRLRVVPTDKSFYMASPSYEEIARKLSSLVQKYIDLPTVNSAPATKFDFPVSGLKKAQYERLESLVRRLNKIDPQLMPTEVAVVISKWEDKSARNQSSVARPPQLDSLGRSTAIGHRKSASARVVMAEAREGTEGQFLVNGKPLEEYFTQLLSRQKITYPLKVIDSLGAYNIFATVQGGGVTGQTDAVANGVAKALVIQNPLLKSRLAKSGYLTRDVRIKERKKPGLAKARKAYTWVKR